MQVQPINNNHNNTNFGAIKATAEAKEYIKGNFSKRAIRKLDTLIEQQKNNLYDVNLSVEKFKPDSLADALFYSACNCDYLQIQAGDKIFDDINPFKSAIRQIKKAVKYLSTYKKASDFEFEKNRILEKLK